MNEKEIEIMADADVAQNIALMAKREILERGITVVRFARELGADVAFVRRLLDAVAVLLRMDDMLQEGRA